MSGTAVLQIQWTQDNQLVTVQFDASISEQHTGSAQVTEQQVERGPNVTDHIRPMPRRLSLQAFVTDTPITGVILKPTTGSPGAVTGLTPGNFDDRAANGAQVLQFNTPIMRVTSVYDTLMAAMAAGVLVTVTTSLATYANFAITNIVTPRDADHANAVQFAIDLQEIITVSVANVATPAPLAQKQHAGQKTTSAASTQQQQQTTSALQNLLNVSPNQ